MEVEEDSWAGMDRDEAVSPDRTADSQDRTSCFTG